MEKIINAPHNKITLGFFSTGPGCAPSYSFPEGKTASILKRLEEIKHAFNEDGTFNRNYAYAEAYALCLNHEGKKTSALELFTLIAGSSEKLLFQIQGEFPMVVNTPGKLGLEGLHTYAWLLNEFNKKDEARKRLLEIVNHYPLKMGIRGVDIAEEAINEIMKTECYPFFKKSFYQEKLKQIKSNTY